MEVIRLEGVYKVYEYKGGSVVALKDIHLTVNRGEVIAVVGPSGSGKTTLLNIIGGVDKPSAGKVIVNGKNIAALSERELSRYRLFEVGYVFQFFNLIPTLTAAENIEIPLILAKKPLSERRKRVEELLKFFGLEDKADRLPEEMSGGERQRVAIAVAIANDPPIVLADEPTAEVDSENARKIMSLFLKLAKEYNKTVIVATHDPRVARMADRIVLLEDGAIKAIVSPAEVSESLAEGIVKHGAMEPSVASWLRSRIKALKEEIAKLEEEFRQGRISGDEYFRKRHELEVRIDALKKELLALGIVE